MPLQIRRGTSPERELITPKIGELIYDTDLKIVYVGDGTTPGGILANGVSANGAKDAAAEMILNGNHQGISFSYNEETKILSAVVDEDDPGTPKVFVGSLFSNDSVLLVDGLTGRIVGPVYSNIFANDSTLLVDSENKTINLNQTVFSDIIPKDNDTFDIGSESNKFLRGFFSGPITTDDSMTALRLTTRRIETPTSPNNADLRIVNEAPQGQLFLQSNNNLNIRTFGSQSRLVVGPSSNTDTASGLVDFVSTSVPAIGRFGFNLMHHHNDAETINFSVIRTRGTVENWETVQANDLLARILFWGASADDFSPTSKLAQPGAAIIVECTDTPIDAAVPAKIIFATTAVGEPIVSPKAELTGDGTWRSNKLQSYTNSTPLNLLSIPKLPTFVDEAAANASVNNTPENGMMYYDSGASKIKVYENGSWNTIT